MPVVLATANPSHTTCAISEDITYLTADIRQTFHRWRHQNGGLEQDAKRLKALEAENQKLKRLVAELAKQMLQDVVREKRVLSTVARGRAVNQL